MQMLTLHEPSRIYMKMQSLMVNTMFMSPPDFEFDPARLVGFFGKWERSLIASNLDKFMQ